MNKFIFNLIFLLYLSGCKNRDSFNVEQVQEDVIISISEDYKDINSENVFLRYPIQFIITKNSNIDHMLLYVKLDNNLQSKFNDYQVLDDQYNVIYDFEKGKIDKKANFKIIFNYLTISKKNLNKEQLSAFNKLGRSDSLIINKSKSVINELNKEPDSIIIRAFSKDELLSEKRLRIKW